MRRGVTPRALLLVCKTEELEMLDETKAALKEANIRFDELRSFL